MLINEVSKKLNITKRAIKFYEENGLLHPKKLNNNYRDYSGEDILILQKISLYRKLGISVQDIKSLLRNNDRELLEKIYREKLSEINLKSKEMELFKLYLDKGDVTEAEEMLDYENVAEAIGSLLPGVWGNYLISHFKPFLNINIKTNEQKEALNKILDYCDNTYIKIPFIMRISEKLSNSIINKQTAEEMIARYQDISEVEYEKLKKQTLQGVKLKTGILRFHPVFAAQRSFQIELQNKGYNDILIPNLKKLSPKYAEYKDALDSINERICNELGLFYDSKFNLKIKK